MKTLMHICCAPCANQPIEVLRTDGIEVAGFWYNPNIHPFTEYRSRRNCLREYAETMEQLFRQYPGIAKKMASIARYHSQTAASALVSLDWNSKYKKSRLVGSNDLYELHGLPKNKQQKAIRMSFCNPIIPLLRVFPLTKYN